MSMKIQITIDSVVTEATPEATAEAIAKRFNVLVEITGNYSPAGMEMKIIGRPYDVVQMVMTDNGGWSTGDDQDDAEMLFHLFRDAKPVFG